MSKIKTKCPHCSGPIILTFGQGLHFGRLNWWREFECSRCGSQEHLDDSGLPPPELRQVLLAEWGEWEVVLPDLGDMGTRVTHALTVLRQALGLSLADIAILRQHIPGAIRRGTPPELEWLQRQLETVGIPSSLQHVTGSDAPSI